jgi:hypothetical protein
MAFNAEHKQKIKKQYLETPNELYTPKFFEKRTTKMRKWECPIGKWLAQELQITSMVDFGCAVGSFLEGALKGGVKRIRGYEYAYDSALPYIPAHIKPHISFGDAGKPIDCGKFDLAMSIEVAEHLLPEQSDTFVANLTNAGEKYVILTAAPPTQDGYYHLNLQPYEFWIDKIEARGWKLRTDLADKAKAAWASVPNVPGHINRNIMFFTPKD